MEKFYFKIIYNETATKQSVYKVSYSSGKYQSEADIKQFGTVSIVNKSPQAYCKHNAYYAYKKPSHSCKASEYSTAVFKISKVKYFKIAYMQKWNSSLFLQNANRPELYELVNANQNCSGDERKNKQKRLLSHSRLQPAAKRQAVIFLFLYYTCTACTKCRMSSVCAYSCGVDPATFALSPSTLVTVYTASELSERVTFTEETMSTASEVFLQQIKSYKIPRQPQQL